MNEIKMSHWAKVKIGVRLLLIQSRWDDMRMQGTGFGFALDPWLVACWDAEPDALLAARKRHLEYFNTHPIAAWLVAGIVCRQEAIAAASTDSVREDAIAKVKSLKIGLGASLAGSYDSFFWGALRPASVMAGLLTALIFMHFNKAHMPMWTVIIMLGVYNIPAITARLSGLMLGSAQGERAAAQLVSLPVQWWIRILWWTTIVLSLLVLVIGAGQLNQNGRCLALFMFVGSLISAWYGVSYRTQIGLVGLGGAAMSVMGLKP